MVTKTEQTPQQTAKPAYVAPKVRIMNEKEIFSALQVSVNANTWWAAM